MISAVAQSFTDGAREGTGLEGFQRFRQCQRPRCLCGARDVGSLFHGQSIFQCRRDDRRRRLRQKLVGPGDHFFDRSLVRNPRHRAQPFGDFQSPFFIGLQPKFTLRLKISAAPQTGNRRQIVGGYRRKCQFRILGWWIALEPE